jgi:1-acyl-sn-glycerol-3-phosphate acyltransferase
MDTGVKLDGILYGVVRALAWMLTHLVCRYQVSGQEHIPRDGALLVVANHLSWYDPLLLGAVLPRRVWFYTKAEIFSWPLAGWFARHTGQIPVHRGGADRAALEKALAYLHEGKAVVIFPEGTVARQERMITAHPGVAMLAMRSGATILPIAHSGTRRVLRSPRWWFPRVTVRIGTPYVPSIPEGTTRKASLQIITQEIMEQIAQMLPPEQRGVYAT